MMRALAEFIMRSRITAILVALVGSWVPLLTQGTIGLVTLRKGWQEGILITMWSVLPILAGLWLDDISIAMVAASIAVLLVAYFASLCLRKTAC